MAVDQSQFDQDLTALVGAITELTTAVDAVLAAHPAGTDFTAEEQQVQAASAAVKAELDKINTPAPPAGEEPVQG